MIIDLSVLLPTIIEMIATYLTTKHNKNKLALNDTNTNAVADQCATAKRNVHFVHNLCPLHTREDCIRVVYVWLDAI